MFKSNSKIQWCSTLTYTPIQLRQQPQVVLVRPTDKLCDFLLQTTKLPVTMDEVSELCAIINFICLTHSTVPVCSTKSFRVGHRFHLSPIDSPNLESTFQGCAFNTYKTDRMGSTYPSIHKIKPEQPGKTIKGQLVWTLSIENYHKFGDWPHWKQRASWCLANDRWRDTTLAWSQSGLSWISGLPQSNHPA